MLPRRSFRLSAFVLALVGVTSCHGTPPRDDATASGAETESAVDPEVAQLFSELDRAVRADPHDANARGRLGMAHQANGLNGRALDDYERAITLDPGNPKWWYLSALLQVDLADDRRGMAHLDSALARAPDAAHVHWRRGLLWLDLGDVDRADSAFARAIALKPNHPAARIGRARVQLRRGRGGDIAADLEDAIARRPGSPYAPYFHQLLGMAYRQVGRLDEAKLELTRGRAASPAFSDPWLDELEEFRVSVASRLRMAHDLIRNGHDEQAIPLLERVRAVDPVNPTLLQYLGAAHLSLGNLSIAREILEGAIELRPDDAIAHATLALVLLELDGSPGALDEADRAASLNPSLAFAHATRGRVLVRLSRNAEAAQAYGEAIRLAPTDVALLLAAGSVAETLGRWAQAESLAKRALQVDPRHAGAQAQLDRTRAGGGR